MWPHNSERPFGTSLILGAAHAFDPFLSRFAGFEEIREILCLVCNLCSVELHYAHGVEGLIIVNCRAYIRTALRRGGADVLAGTASRRLLIPSAPSEAPPGVGQELQSNESKPKESDDIIEDIPTVKEGKDHE
jgi:hypothetical protein